MARLGGRQCFRHPIAWATAMLVLSCGNPTGVDLPPAGDVSAISVDPVTSTLAVGGELPLHAVVMDGSGHPTATAPILWSVRDPNIASVSATGVVTGRAVGTTQVAASAGGKSGTATITVQPPPVASVIVSPAPLSLILGQVRQISAVTRDARGAELIGRSVSWSSANAGVAAVSPEGAVTATGIGTTIITATSEGVTGGTTVTVSPVPVATISVQPTSATVTVGQAAVLDAVLKDATGTPLDRTDRPVAWSSSDDAVARVSAGGVVTGVAPGKATITATRESVSGTSVITVATVPVGSVTVQPNVASLIVGESTTLAATVQDASGGPLANRVVTWTSSDASVATVTAAGVATAVRAGSATISATSEGRTGSASITVVRAPVLTVSVQPTTLSIPSGQSQPLTVTVTDANHVIVNDRDVKWTSSSELVATVSANGIVTGHALGSATITATAEGKSGSAQVTVTGAAVSSVTIQPASSSVTVGQTTTLTATVTDANGAVVTDRVLTWSSSSSAVATVSATGVVSAIAAGTAVITATSEGKAGSATVIVTPLPVGSVAVEPTSVTLLPGATATLTATVRDAAGTVVTDRAVTWSSSNTGVATVSTSGVVTAVAPGSATISATAEGKSGSTTVNVTVVPVGSVAVQPTSVSLTVGQPKQLTSVVTDAYGVVVTDRVVTWSSSSDAVARVSAIGLVTGVAPGTVTITATSESRSASALVTVTQAPVGTVSVQPASSALAVGQTTPLAATVRDANGTIVADRLVTWSSNNPAVAAVNAATGVVTGVAVGSATITAMSESKSGSAAVTVTAVPVASVVVQPSTTNLNVGQTTVLSATVTDAKGTVVTDRPITWTSSNPLVATVSPTGVLTAMAPGSATISASAGGKSGAASVVVTLVPVGSIAVEPTSAIIIAGHTTTLVATVRDANGAVVTDRPISWTSSNTSIATVSASGVVVAVAPGSATVTATSGSKSASASVTVTPVPVGSVAVAPTTASLVAGSTTTLAVIVKDANGAIVTDRVVTWSSNNIGVATVNATTGVVTGVSVGSATITAAAEGRSGSSTVTVTPVPVGSVAVQPAIAGVAIGQTTPLTATVKDANGTIVTDRLVTWSSSNALVATVSATGLVTGVAVGSATITAISEGKSGSAAVTVTAVPVASVVVQPSTANLNVGQTTVLSATVTDANGTVVTDRPITWVSSNPLVATVSPSGVLTAVAPGSATISASAGGKSGAASVVVTLVPVGSVAVQPASASLVAGQTTTLAATVRDANGAVVTNRPVTWTSSNPSVGTVSAAGVVTAVAPGSAIITATSESKSGSASVTVTPVPVGSVTVAPATKSLVDGTTTTLTATVRNTNGAIVTDRPVTWSSSNTAVATVSATGLVTAVSVGTATITATSEGKTGASTITVTPAPVASVTVQPLSASLYVGQTVGLSATVTDANGTVVTNRPVAWTSSNNLVATVSTTGVVTAVAPGSATISATSEGKIGSSAVNVTLVPVGAVAVQPPTANLIVGQTTPLTAVVTDANGVVVIGRAVAWASSNTTVATVSPGGVVTAVAPGGATITATSEGKSGTATLTVTPVPVASVTVAPATKSLVDGTTTTLTATVRDANGTIVTNRVVTWSSSNELVAAVSATGVVTAVSVGTATITATSESKSGNAAITVTPVPVASVMVQPTSASLVVGQTTTLTATVTDANGTVVTDRLVTWGSSNMSVATVSSSGVVKAVSTGTATITATSETKSGSTALTVTPAPVGSVTILPSTSSRASGQTVQLTATVRDTTGAVVTDRPVSWTSSDTLVATVSASGLVSALTTGTATITATSETKSGTASVTVTPGPAAVVIVTPSAIAVANKKSVQLTASAADAKGNQITGRSFNWQSDDDDIATVTSTGLVRGMKVGSVMISARLDGKTDKAAVMVIP